VPEAPSQAFVILVSVDHTIWSSLKSEGHITRTCPSGLNPNFSISSCIAMFTSRITTPNRITLSKALNELHNLVRILVDISGFRHASATGSLIMASIWLSGIMPVSNFSQTFCSLTRSVWRVRIRLRR
jgi:hypothetical protein